MSTWHEQMAEAVSQRQHALNGITRWQEKLRAAEAKIEQLSKAHLVNDIPPSPQVVSEQVESIPSALTPVFGISQDAPASATVNA